jgi:hypothetical protein
VVEQQSFILANNIGPADARGGIAVDADAVRIGSGAGLTADALGLGDAGRLTIQADEMLVTDGSFIRSSTFAAGDAGVVTVEAGRLRVAGAAAAILSDAIGGTGNGGTVKVATGEVEARDSGRIVVKTHLGTRRLSGRPRRRLAAGRARGQRRSSTWPEA